MAEGDSLGNFNPRTHAGCDGRIIPPLSM
jgi:hypothetical protein